MARYATPDRVKVRDVQFQAMEGISVSIDARWYRSKKGLTLPNGEFSQFLSQPVDAKTDMILLVTEGHLQ